ncbi:hypothetical protein HK097_006793 [Rhizophlyctis rosea]|uniref:Uncharacterized protein n=1 Tax=Rhizophlyctis rosea TaxID=64517 RepID=A0AAD5X874_9FUNG|nr:hypothetical protein HK097_006793 [Rhizophlyctis rosea]
MERWDSVLMDPAFTVDLNNGSPTPRTSDSIPSVEFGITSIREMHLRLQKDMQNGFIDEDDADDDGDITNAGKEGSKTQAAEDSDDEDDDFYSVSGDAPNRNSFDDMSEVGDGDVWFDPRPSIEFGFGRPSLDSIAVQREAHSGGWHRAVVPGVAESNMWGSAVNGGEEYQEEQSSLQKSDVEAEDTASAEVTDDDDEIGTVVDPADLKERNEEGIPDLKQPAEISLHEREAEPSAPSEDPLPASSSPLSLQIADYTLPPPSTAVPSDASHSRSSILTTLPDTITLSRSPSPPPTTNQWTPPVRDPWAPSTDPWLPSPPRLDDTSSMSMRDSITSLANARRARVGIRGWESAWDEFDDGGLRDEVRARDTTGAKSGQNGTAAVGVTVVEEQSAARTEVAAEPDVIELVIPLPLFDPLKSPAAPPSSYTHATRLSITPFGRFQNPIRQKESRLDSVLCIPDEDGDDDSDTGEPFERFDRFGLEAIGEGDEEGEVQEPEHWDDISLGDNASVCGVGRGSDTDARSIRSVRSVGSGRNGLRASNRRPSVKNIDELLYGPGARDGVDTGKIMVKAETNGKDVDKRKVASARDLRKQTANGKEGKFGKTASAQKQQPKFRTTQQQRTGWEELITSPYPIAARSFAYTDVERNIPVDDYIHLSQKQNLITNQSTMPFTARPRASLQIDTFRSPSHDPVTPLTRATSIDFSRPRQQQYVRRQSDDTHPLPHFNLLLYGAGVVQRRKTVAVRGGTVREKKGEKSGLGLKMGKKDGDKGTGTGVSRWGVWVASGRVVGVPEGALIRK